MTGQDVIDAAATIARLTSICNRQEEIIASLSDLARALMEEVAQHRAVGAEEKRLEEVMSWMQP